MFSFENKHNNRLVSTHRLTSHNIREAVFIYINAHTCKIYYCKNCFSFFPPPLWNSKSSLSRLQIKFTNQFSFKTEILFQKQTNHWNHLLEKVSYSYTYKILPCAMYTITPELWGCSESYAYYFIMLACNIRGRWWYGSRGWTFPPILCGMLLLCDRWQQRDIHESKVCHWIPPCRKKKHLLTFISTCEHSWRPNSGNDHSEAVGSPFQQWWEQQWVTPTGANFYEGSTQFLFIDGESA